MISCASLLLWALMIAAGEPACPVQWRGVPLRDAFAELGEHLSVPYVLDPSIPPEALKQEIRFAAAHLTCDQAFRWLARIGGLEAVKVSGVVLVAPRSSMPAVWQTRGGLTPFRKSSRSEALEDGVRPPGPPSRALSVLGAGRQADINWSDVPLTRVAQDVSSLFGVDVIFDPAIASEQPLVTAQLATADLPRVGQALQEQLSAAAEVVDGAIWLHPAPATAPTTGRVSVTSRPASPQTTGAELTALVCIDPTVHGWRDFASAMAAATGAEVSLQGPAASDYPAIEANGSASEVLEGARLLGLITYSADRTAAGNGKVLLRVVQRRK